MKKLLPLLVFTQIRYARPLKTLRAGPYHHTASVLYPLACDRYFAQKYTGISAKPKTAVSFFLLFNKNSIA
jgi:hypothetical protein